MFVPRTLRDFGDLVMFFHEVKVAVRVDNEQQIVDVGPIRIRWDVRHPFVHVTRAIEASVPRDRAGAIALAVAAHNHAAQLPVLDFDATTGALAVRITTPVLVDGVRLDLLEALLAGIDARVDELRATFAPLIDAPST